MICDKCGKDIPENNWVSGETYKGIDQHHNPPKFLMENWKGEICNLCRKCHHKTNKDRKNWENYLK